MEELVHDHDVAVGSQTLRGKLKSGPYCSGPYCRFVLLPWGEFEN